MQQTKSALSRASAIGKWADVQDDKHSDVKTTTSFSLPRYVPHPFVRDSRTEKATSLVLGSKKGLGRSSEKKPKPKKKKGGPSLSQTIKHHVGRGASWAWDFLVKRIFGATTATLAERLKLTKLAAATTEKEYVSVFGGGDLQSKIKLCDDQLSVLRGEMSAAMRTAGMRVFKISLPFPLTAYRVSTVTSGIVNNVVTITPNDPTEFASVVVLFEEYKMTGLTVISNNMLLTPAVGNQTTDSSMTVSVADPADAGVLTSVSSGAQYAMRQFYANGGGYSTYGANEGGARGLTHWDIRFPKGQQFDNSGASMYAAQDEWLPANASVTVPPRYCYIKHYTVQAVVTASNVSSALMFYHLEFRSRQ